MKNSIQNIIDECMKIPGAKARRCQKQCIDKAVNSNDKKYCRQNVKEIKKAISV